MNAGKMKFWLPAAGFVILAALLAVGLTLNPREVPSPLIGKPAPEFELAQLSNPDAVFGPEAMRGKVWLLNVWASWCVSCRAEHQVLEQLAARNLVPIVGLNYKDRPADAKRWLQNFGDPYAMSVMDHDGRVGIDWGVYGVPETFLVDQTGIIRYKRIGPVTEEFLKDTLIPRIESLTETSSRRSTATSERDS